MQKRFGGIHVWQWLILLVHALLYFHWWRNSVFYADDGIWLSNVRTFHAEGWTSIRQLFVGGQPGSIFRHSQLAPLLHLIPYSIVPRVESILVFVAFLHLCTQFLWVRFGHAIGRPALGTLVALLYFWTPAMCCYYGLRIWQIVYLPMVVSVFAVSLLDYGRRPTGRGLFVLCLWVALACHFHMLSGFLFAVVAIYFLFHPAPISLREYGACVGAVAAILAPVVGPIFSEQPALIPVALAAVLCPWFARRWRLFSANGGEKWILACIAALVVGALVRRPEVARIPLLIFDMIAAPNPWLNGKFGFPRGGFAAWQSYPVLLLLVAAGLGIKSFGTHGPLRRAVFWLNVVPAAFLFVSHAFHYLGPHQYFLILLPGIWLAIAFLVFDFDARSLPPTLARARWIAGTCLVFVVALQSMSLQRHVTATGGVGMRCSSLGTKLAVIDELMASGARPQVVPLATHVESHWRSCLTEVAWGPLVSERAPPAVDDGTVAYVSEPRALGYVQSRLSEMSNLSSTKVGSVVLYRGAVIR